MQTCACCVGKSAFSYYTIMKKFNIPYSLLDLATITAADLSAADAFQRSKVIAQTAESLGYHRYWFAEHHNMESVASSATSVLIGFIGTQTSRIRVGAGGVMLPNHAPLIIAEQFGTLAHLFPGRIDLGLGRAPGTDPVTSYALRRNLTSGADNFPADVVELLQYLGPRKEGVKVRAIPGENTAVPVWLLGSSTYSAQLAAGLGLPFAFASHFAPTHLEEALDLYRRGFQPSTYLQEPYAMACVNAIVAETKPAAEQLATSFYQLALGLFRDDRKPLPPPVADMDAIWNEREKLGVQHMMHYSFIGDSNGVQADLSAFIERTGVNEIMFTSHIYDMKARIYSLERIAGMFNGS